jgi:type I restriction enzyme R subunit
MKFTEAKLEAAFIDLLARVGIPHTLGIDLHRHPEEVLLKDDLRAYLLRAYAPEGLQAQEVETIIRELERLPASDLYESNKVFMKMITEGFVFKREDRSQKDVFIRLLHLPEITRQETDPETASEVTPFAPEEDEVWLAADSEGGTYRTRDDHNIYRFVTQMEVVGTERRIPDGILYINGLPMVVIEFKSAIREEATIHDAFVQLTTRYRRDIPELFKYNAFCVLSDGVNNKAGSFFGAYDYFYAWRKIVGDEKPKDGINSLHTLVEGMLNPWRLRDIIGNFIYVPDTSKRETKVVCRYPQYYAARKLFENIKLHQRPMGDGKGGTYFGATGCGKSYTMLFLTRLLMKSPHFGSPTIVLITDRTDLDGQLSEQFTEAKDYIGDQMVLSVESREHLRTLLQGRKSGGVFLTTIHKFTEDTQLLTDRTNVICISDEAHRSQVNLDQKVKVTADGVTKTYGFAKYLHDSLPNATYVGFTGTPIDATLDVFGKVVDAYTMTESVRDEITVKIVHEGRAAKVLLETEKLAEIEAYYQRCAEAGTNEYQVEESKKAMAQMRMIIGDPKRLQTIADDFVKHYEKRIEEGASVKGKAMFVCSSREIAYTFYQAVTTLRPEWLEVKTCEDGADLTEKEKKEIKPMERIKMIMTRGQDDPEELYKLVGTKEYKKELDRQFKNAKSNFKIAIVVDMWLTGFDVPFLDTIYIDKPIERHNLIQTISRVNRTYTGKDKGLVVDYIGIKSQMNLALAHYNKDDKDVFEDMQQSIVIARDHLDLLARIFHKFDTRPYFHGKPLEQLHCLNMASEYVQLTQELEKRFMYLVKRLKAAYDICAGSAVFTQDERDHIHFYLAVRSIVFKLNRGGDEAPDIAQMNAKVQKMFTEALKSDGIEEILKLGDDSIKEVDLFDADYLAKLDKIKLPNTKIKLLQQLLAKAISEFKKVNRIQGVDFSQKMKALVDRYNDRKETDVLRSEVLEDFTNEILELMDALRKEMLSFGELGIDFEEKAFYDILKMLARKYDFEYPEDKLIHLAREVKKVVDDKAKYTDWSRRDDIKAELKVDLIILLAENDYPPIDRDEVYKEIFEQAEGFKKGR